MNNCLIVNDKIRNLAKKLKGETEETIKGLVALWQKQNNKSIEDYPELEVLNEFKNSLREGNYINVNYYSSILLFFF